MTTEDNQNSCYPDRSAESREIDELRRQLQQARQRIDELDAKRREAIANQKLTTSLRAETQRLREEIESLRTSNSWKITAPIRRLSTFARAAQLAFVSVRQHAEQRGGVGPALSYYGSVVRSEGFSGFRARIKRRMGTTSVANPASDAIYHAWIAEHDSLTPAMRADIRRRIDLFAHKPSFSIIVPTYNTNPQYLREMIQAVKQQIYSNWELCIADDASSDPRVREILLEESARDPRIKVTFRETNGHISEASNSALALASGNFFALLDHDDVIPDHALFMVAQSINRHPEAKMFFSDEDKLNADGERTAPYFKSDWNREMMLAQNMFTHLAVFEAALVREAGGFRKGFEGSQDHDLTLRCAFLAGDDNIVHIPHVLYHWRIAEGSTAKSSGEKPYTVEAAIRAVENHLKRNHVAATVRQLENGVPMLRVHYTVPTPAPLVSLLIPTRDRVDLLRQCIDSVIRMTTYSNYEIVVIDNGSEKLETHQYFDKIRMHPNVRILRDDSPFNYSTINNRAAAQSKGTYLCLLNNDIEVISPDWLEEMVGLASQPGNGAVGAALWYPNDTLQHGGIITGIGGVAGHMHSLLRRGDYGYFARASITQNLSAVTAACLVIRKSIYDEVGGLDELLAVAFNDVDFCLRVRQAGYRNVWTPHAELYHHESASRGSDLSGEKLARFAKEVRFMQDRWTTKLDQDPAYNPNLSLDPALPPFSLESPPRKGMLE